ncbi:hypothetical protein CsSME_00001717 [Camellia sinensis var. sinensis]
MTNPSVVPKSNSHQWILFLGTRSFEFEDQEVDKIGRCQIAIVERGLGLRREVVLIGNEIQWLVSRMQLAMKYGEHVSFLGCLQGGPRSMAWWLREDEDGPTIQVVVLMEESTLTNFHSILDFGGWLGGSCIGP